VLGAFDGSDLIGMTGFYRDKNMNERHKGHIWGVFVEQSYRGRKLAKP
jgi:Acetyltransferase (GNAT) family